MLIPRIDGVTLNIPLNLVPNLIKDSGSPQHVLVLFCVFFFFF